MFPRAAGSEGPERLSVLRPAATGDRALKRFLVTALALLALAGCGGDDEPAADTTPPLPELTAPSEEPTETADPTEPDPATEELAPPIETAPAPEGDDSGGTPAPTPETAPDTPENDTPPPADSPAEQFEEFCDDNPGACG